MSKDQLLENIKLEIEKTGFPLEMRIANILRTRKYYVGQSVYYIDSDEGKPREMDIKAHYNVMLPAANGELRFIRNFLIIECKKNDGYPLVFMSSQREENGIPIVHNLYMSNYMSDGIELPMNYTNVMVISQTHPYSMYTKYARSGFQAFKKSDVNVTANDMVFKGIHSVSKATNFFDNDRKNMMDIRIHYPMMVVSGEIFEAVLNNTQEIEVEKVDSVLYLHNYASEKGEANDQLILVIKESALGSFLDKLESTYQIAAVMINNKLNQT